MEERLGHVLCGKYTLQRAIGQGGMASVYEATHRNGLRVAIKVLAPELCANADVKARFLREGYVANSVEHPRVVRVLDDDIDKGTVFLVLELLRGESVAARASQYGGRLPEALALTIAIELCDVLDAAHERGIIHRDLKPDNLFLDEVTGLRVLDFGIARFKSSCATLGTRTGVLLGTPGFMPKEQALGEMESIDARTDLWAVGATLHSLLAGKPVHEARTPEAMLVKVATEAVPTIRNLAPWVSEATAGIVDRALKMERADRYESASEMRDALTAALNSLPPDEVAVASTMHATPISSARRERPRSEASIPPVTTPVAEAIGSNLTPVDAMSPTLDSGASLPALAQNHFGPPFGKRVFAIGAALVAVATLGVLQIRTGNAAHLRDVPAMTLRLGAPPEPMPVAPVSTTALSAEKIAAPRSNIAVAAPALSAAAVLSTAPSAKPSAPAPKKRPAAPSDPFENP